MKCLAALAVLATLFGVACACCLGIEAGKMRAFQMREDYGTEPLADCYMQYYYMIPCPTNSWFWAMDNTTGCAWGVFYTVGDPSMQRPDSGCPPFQACDPYADHSISRFRILDFAAYGTTYPGYWTVEFDIWCADPLGCPVGPSLWNSGPVDMCANWNYIQVTPPLCLSNCGTGNPPGYPRFLITATAVGAMETYPAWGFDNISYPVTMGCQMHDYGCCPALYPRPYVSHYATMHSGWYGQRRPGGLELCPPIWLPDGQDTAGDVYGFLEMAWRVYLTHTGPTAAQPSTWGAIKAMYR